MSVCVGDYAISCTGLKAQFRLRKTGVAVGCLETFGSAASETTLDDFGV